MYGHNDVSRYGRGMSLFSVGQHLVFFGITGKPEHITDFPFTMVSVLFCARMIVVFKVLYSSSILTVRRWRLLARPGISQILR